MTERPLPPPSALPPWRGGPAKPGSRLAKRQAEVERLFHEMVAEAVDTVAARYREADVPVKAQPS